MSKKIKDEQKKFLGETLNQYDKALDETINQLDKKNREQNHKISSLVNSFDNEYLEKDVEGNMTTLENSKDGMVIINEIQGSTEVNYCKDGEKELILNGDIDTQGESFVTITEGVDGGLVDVSLEGNTEINLSKTKDPVLVTREFDDINCNTGKLQYTIDDVTTINDEPGKVDIDRIVGDTMVNHAVNGSEELILNAHINESGDNSIKLNGVTSDGGKVDVTLEGNTLVNVSKTKNVTAITKEGEDTTGNHIVLADEGRIRPVLNGNTLVNVCDQKDPVAITKSYTVETGNHIALQGEYDGKARPVPTGNTLVNCITTDIGSLSYTADGTAQRDWYNIIAKPNTIYTAIANVTKNTIDNNFALIGWNVTSDNTQVLIPNGFTGTFVQSFTTKSSDVPNPWSTDLWKENTTGEIALDSFMILEGDYTNKPIPSYFEGLKSSFEDKVVPNCLVQNTTRWEWSSDNKDFYILSESDTPITSNKITVVIECSSVNDKDLGIAYKCDGVTEYVTTSTKVGISTICIENTGEINKLRLYRDSSGEGYVVNKAYIVEGDYTNYDFSDYDPTNAGKYKVDYVVTGKNKAKSPIYLTASQYNSSVKINGILKPDTTYAVSLVIPTGQKFVSEYKNTFTERRAISGDGTRKSIILRTKKDIIPDSLGRTLIFFNEDNYSSDGTASDLQIEEGSTATSYEPYKEYKKTFYLNSPLLEGDTIEQQGNNVVHVHRYGKVVLDGSEDEVWTQDNLNLDTRNNYSMYYVNGTIGTGTNYTRVSGLIICDRFKETEYNYTTGLSGDLVGIATINNRLLISIPKSSLSSIDSAGFKQWLQSNPVTVVYKLKTPQYEVISQNDTILCDSYINGHLDVDSVVPIKKVEFKRWGKKLKYVYPSTQYNVQFESDNIGNMYFLDVPTGLIQSIQSINKGINKFTVTTSSNITYNYLTIEGIGFNASNIVVTPAIEQDFDYFSGMQSCFEDNLVTEGENAGKYKVDYVVTGKNKLNPDYISHYIRESHTINGVQITYNIDETITLNGTCTENTWLFSNVDVAKHLTNGKAYRISGLNMVIYNKDGSIEYNEFVMSKNVEKAEIYLQMLIGEEFNNTILKPQLEEGNVTTEYEPYKEYTKTLYLNSPLLEGDTIEEKDGEIYHIHRYKEVVLDGSELGWQDNAGEGDTNNGHGIWNVNLHRECIGMNVKCDKLQAYDKANEVSGKTDFMLTYIDSNAIIVNIKGASTKSDVTDWLKNNRPKIILKLVEPQYELIQQSDTIAMPTYSTGHLDVTTAVPLDKVNFLHFEEELTYLYPSTQ